MNYEIATTETEWHELRSKGLGGSDIGTMLGLNPYKTKYQLWLEKTGQVQPEDISDKLHIQIGNELEDLVARIFEQETGLKVQRDNKTHYHPKYPFLLANIDRKIVGERALLECKTTSTFSKKQWEDDEVPASYLMQVHHYLNVLDYDYAYIAVIIGNSDFVYKKIERDEELITNYTNMAIDFWNNYVLGGREPEIDYTDKQAIAFLDDQMDPALERPATADELLLVEEICYLTDQRKMAQKMEDEAKGKLKKSMADTGAGNLSSESFKVNLTKYEADSFEKTKFKKDYPDLYEKYIKKDQRSRLNIKKENDNNGNN